MHRPFQPRVHKCPLFRRKEGIPKPLISLRSVGRCSCLHSGRSRCLHPVVQEDLVGQVGPAGLARLWVLGSLFGQVGRADRVGHCRLGGLQDQVGLVVLVALGGLGQVVPLVSSVG
jgi:hypothetical protein